MKQFIFSLFLLFAFVNNVISEWTDVDWMSYINGNLKLNQINIPGTHDSGTSGIKMDDGLTNKMAQPQPGGPNFFDLIRADVEYAKEYNSRTQDKTIKEQLNVGVRYFDIRLAWHADGQVHLVHDFVDCLDENGKTLFLQRILSDCAEFLDQHKSETIILHLSREENNTNNHGYMKNQINGYIKNYINANKMYNTEMEDNRKRIPTLEEARGKMVIITRNEEYNGICIKLDDKPTEIKYDTKDCDFNKNYKCRIQDGYKLKVDEKWEAAQKLINDQGYFKQGEKPGESVVSINFLSTANGNLKGTSSTINGRLIKGDPVKLQPGKQYGWILVDFVDSAVARTIYKSNNNNNINETIEEKLAINTENNVFTEDQVKHLYNGDEAHDRCIRKIKDVVWFRSEKNNIKEHLSMKNIEKFCFRYNCVKAYSPEGTCESKEKYWNTCKKNIINELNSWISGNWKVMNINHC